MFAKEPTRVRTLDFKQAVYSGRLLLQQKIHSHVMHCNAGGGFSVKRATMSMAMKNQVGAVTIHDLRQSRVSEERVNLLCFACDCGGNGRVVQDHNSLGRSELRHGTFQLDRFVNRSLHKSLDLALAECSQYPAAETPDEAFGAGKAYAVSFVACAVQHFDSRARHHPLQFGFLTAFVIVISQHRYGW